MKVEADIFLIAKKYGVKNVGEFDTKIKKGFISEKEGFEDFFALDGFTAERNKIKKFLKTL